MPKVIREYTFEGDEKWLRTVMEHSVPLGNWNHPFMEWKDSRIEVREIYNDLTINKKENGNAN